MNKMPYIIIGLAAVAAVALLVGCQKKEPTPTDEIDGGVTKHTDTDAPKVIESTLITNFECEVSTYAEAEEDEYSGLNYVFSAKLENGAVKAKYENHDRNGNASKAQFRASVAFMRELYQVVSKYDFARYNGNTHIVSGLPDMYGAVIDIKFGSGESIYAADNQSNFIPHEAVIELVDLFEKHSVTGVNKWQTLNIYRTHSVWNRCFNMSITSGSDGSMLLTGFCISDDGREYSSEEGIDISGKAIAELRRLELDELPDEKKKPGLGFQVMDETVQKLTLTYTNGTKAEKALTDDVLDKVFDILLGEFEAQ